MTAVAALRARSLGRTPARWREMTHSDSRLGGGTKPEATYSKAAAEASETRPTLSRTQAPSAWRHFWLPPPSLLPRVCTATSASWCSSSRRPTETCSAGWRWAHSWTAPRRSPPPRSPRRRRRASSRDPGGTGLETSCPIAARGVFSSQLLYFAVVKATVWRKQEICVDWTSAYSTQKHSDEIIL